MLLNLQVFLISAFCLLEFTWHKNKKLQNALKTTYNVYESEWILMESDNSRPKIFSECPKDDVSCTYCTRMEEEGVAYSLKKLFPEENNLKDKKICFYKITNQGLLDKKKSFPVYSKAFDCANDLVFKFEELCNAFCEQYAGYKCAKGNRDDNYWVFRENKEYYCPYGKSVLILPTNNTNITIGSNNTMNNMTLPFGNNTLRNETRYNKNTTKNTKH